MYCSHVFKMSGFARSLRLTAKGERACTKPVEGTNSRYPLSGRGTSTFTLSAVLERLCSTTDSRYSPS